jgi:hypothetical protein
MVPVTQYAAVLMAGLVLLTVVRRWPGRIVIIAIAAAALLECLPVETGEVTLGVNLYPGDAAGAILLLAGCVVLPGCRGVVS